MEDSMSIQLGGVTSYSSSSPNQVLPIHHALRQ